MPSQSVLLNFIKMINMSTFMICPLLSLKTKSMPVLVQWKVPARIGLSTLFSVSTQVCSRPGSLDMRLWAQEWLLKKNPERVSKMNFQVFTVPPPPTINMPYVSKSSEEENTPTFCIINLSGT